MKALAYTSINQMTYLFLETVREEMGNGIVNDSLQPFVVDLNNAIENNEKEVLDVVQECILEYYSPMANKRGDMFLSVDIYHQVRFVKDKLERWGLAENTNIAVFLEKTLKNNFK